MHNQTIRTRAVPGSFTLQRPNLILLVLLQFGAQCNGDIRSPASADRSVASGTGRALCEGAPQICWPQQRPPTRSNMHMLPDKLLLRRATIKAKRGQT